MLRLTIVSPEGVLKRAETERITLPGEVSGFTLLTDHAPLVSALTAGEIAYLLPDGGEERIAIRRGFVRVSRNEVEACVETDVAKRKKEESVR